MTKKYWKVWLFKSYRYSPLFFFTSKRNKLHEKKERKNCSTIPRSMFFFLFIYYDIVKKIKYPRAMIQCKGTVEKKERIGERREIKKKTMGSVFCWRFGRARSTPFSHTTQTQTSNNNKFLFIRTPHPAL